MQPLHRGKHLTCTGIDDGSPGTKRLYELNLQGPNVPDGITTLTRTKLGAPDF